METPGEDPDVAAGGSGESFIQQRDVECTIVFGGVEVVGAAIVIDNTHPTGQQAKTFAHELAHCALHFGKTDGATALTRNLAELEAESIAYVVCRHFGLDTTIRSSAYIALWQGDSKGLRASLERIASTARAIIDDVDALESAESPKAVAA